MGSRQRAICLVAAVLCPARRRASLLKSARGDGCGGRFSLFPFLSVFLKRRITGIFRLFGGWGGGRRVLWHTCASFAERGPHHAISRVKVESECWASLAAPCKKSDTKSCLLTMLSICASRCRCCSGQCEREISVCHQRNTLLYMFVYVLCFPGSPLKMRWRISRGYPIINSNSNQNLHCKNCWGCWWWPATDRTGLDALSDLHIQYLYFCANVCESWVNHAGVSTSRFLTLVRKVLVVQGKDNECYCTLRYFAVFYLRMIFFFCIWKEHSGSFNPPHFFSFQDSCLKL